LYAFLITLVCATCRVPLQKWQVIVLLKISVVIHSEWLHPLYICFHSLYLNIIIHYKLQFRVAVAQSV
jgi:hypothetical protein